MEDGDNQAAEDLYREVYEDLRLRARRLTGNAGSGLTLQPTAIVHEAWLKLVVGNGIEWADRSHFLAVASRAMRMVLVDHVRARGTLKRSGGSQENQMLDEALVAFEERSVGLIELNDALAKLEGLDPDLAEIVELRFFGGLTIADAATVLRVSSSSIERSWRTARAWLRAELTDDAGLSDA